MHTVYVVGAAGQLGRALAATRPGSATMVGLTSADIDITDADSVRRALADLRRGDVVINAAAYTNVDGAESDADRAFAVNATGAANLAALTAAEGPPKGEVVVLVGPPEAEAPPEAADIDRLLGRLIATHSVREAADEAARATGLPRRTLYQRALALKDGPDDAD